MNFQEYTNKLKAAKTQEQKNLLYKSWLKAEYQGFWSLEYKHTMRAVTKATRKAIYNSFVKWGLDLSGTSDLHQELINTYTGDYLIQGESNSTRIARMQKAYYKGEIN